MSPGRGHFESSLDVLLAFDLAESVGAITAIASGWMGGWTGSSERPLRWAYSAASVSTGMISKLGIRAALAVSSCGARPEALAVR